VGLVLGGNFVAIGFLRNKKRALFDKCALKVFVGIIVYWFYGQSISSNAPPSLLHGAVSF
jgi:hypothetical protein